MVALVATEYVRKGYKVAAEIPGFDAPEPVEGLVPDICAERDGRTVVIEVETRETLFGAEYLSEHKTFRKWKEQAPRNREYKMVIA
jgi:hypothetical protein